MISGRVFIISFLSIMFFLMGSFFYVISNSKGRDHNREEQARELAKQECLGEMLKYIEDQKAKTQPVLIEKLNELSGEFEFYYFPDNFLDMRNILITSVAENMIQLKNFKGELMPKSTSMGYFVMYGGEFKIRDIEKEKFISKFRVNFRLVDPEAEKLITKLLSENALTKPEADLLKDQFSSSFDKYKSEITKITKRLLGEKKINNEEVNLLYSQFPLLPNGEYGSKIDPSVLNLLENKMFLLKKKKDVSKENTK